MGMRDIRLMAGKAGRLCLIQSCLLIGGLASAQAFEATEAQRQACTPDAFRLCSAEIPDIGRITSCMKANRARLSPPCRRVFAEVEASPGMHHHYRHHHLRRAHAHIRRRHHYRSYADYR